MPEPPRPFSSPDPAEARSARSLPPALPQLAPAPVEDAVPPRPAARAPATEPLPEPAPADHDRAAAERAAAEQQRALLKVVLDQGPQGIVVVDAQGRGVLQNHAAERIWQGTPGSTGTYAAFHADGTPLEASEWPWARCLLQRAPVEPEELRFQRFDGTRGILLGSCAPLVGREGLLLGAAWVFTDVTELKQVEAENAELVQQRIRFLNIVSHELLNILTPISIHVQFLKESEAAMADAKRRRSIEVLDRNVERLTLLVKDVMDVARLQTGRLTVEPQHVELGRVVLEAIESFQEPARTAGVQLRWNATPGVAVHADPKRLSQVLFNLLGNALKFTPPGGEVSVSVEQDQGEAVVRVRDTGEGLPADGVRKLFQPFSQLHGKDPAKPGTGLGLFISKGIVEAHGGRIWCESDGPGRGATFAFTLPLHAPAEPESAEVTVVRRA
jgi:signal transduction histidine kinase